MKLKTPKKKEQVSMSHQKMNSSSSTEYFVLRPLYINWTSLKKGSAKTRLHYPKLKAQPWITGL